MLTPLREQTVGSATQRSRKMLYSIYKYFSVFVNAFFASCICMILYEGHLQQANMQREILLKVPNANIYMYTAVAIFLHDSFEDAENAKQKNSFNAVVISAFEIGNDTSVTFKCCFVLKNGTITSTVSSVRRYYPAKAIRRGILLICPLQQSPYFIYGVSIMFKNTQCPTHNYFYKTVLIPQKPLKSNSSEKSVGVCVKIAYGDLDAERLVEWFEATRLFGVDKVFANLYMLNNLARKVFQYYVDAGLAETMEFDLPQKGIQKELYTGNRQGWNDEQVALYNCQAYFLLYDYVIVIDTDEFLVPRTRVFENAWRQLFNALFEKSERAAQYFWTVLHITMWEPATPDHPLFIGKFNNCTVPVIDKEKIVYIPTKIVFGSMITHFVNPLKNYTLEAVDPNTALIHHYRACRGEWLHPRPNKTRTIWLDKRNQMMMKQRDDSYYFNLQEKSYCFDFRRNSSVEMENLSNTINENVSKVLINVLEKGIKGIKFNSIYSGLHLQYMNMFI